MRATRRCLLLAAAAAAAIAGCSAPSHNAGAEPERGSGSAQRHALAASYLRIAIAGNHRLEHDFDSLEGAASRNLAAARADLRDAAATEQLFDRRLLAIAFPPRLAAVARLLVYLNQSRSQLTSAAALLPTLRQLRADEPTLDAANVPVEQQVSVIRKDLGLPPPESS